MSDGRVKHGHNSKIHGISPTYISWMAMKKRCKYRPEYSHVSIDPRWLLFVNFLEDMGDRPDGMTIDRIDNNLGYEKENCRWATPTQQVRNRRHQGGVRWVKPVSKWAAWIGHENKDIYLGYFTEWWDAMCVRKSAENKYWRT